MVRFRWLDKRANNRGIIVRIKNTMYIKLSPFSIYNEAIICPMSRSFPLLSERHTERDPLRFAFNGPPDHHARHHTYQGIRRSVHSGKCTLWLRGTESFIYKPEFLYYRINIDFYLEVKREFYSNPSSPLIDTLLFIQDLLS